jgi:hypothetical protein
MAVVERMPDSPTKRALIIAIQSRMKALKAAIPALARVTSGARPA